MFFDLQTDFKLLGKKRKTCWRKLLEESFRVKLFRRLELGRGAHGCAGGTTRRTLSEPKKNSLPKSVFVPCPCRFLSAALVHANALLLAEGARRLKISKAAT